MQSAIYNPQSESTIALDAHMVGTRETGNETYVVQLAAALGKLGSYSYRLYTPHPEKLPSELTRSPAISVHSFTDVPSPVRIAWLYPRMAQQDRARLLHMTYVSPPRSPCPVVLTVHDVSNRIFPEYFSPRVRLVLGLLVGPSVRRAARVITVSECAKQDIVRFYRIPPRRVVVTPEAAAPRFKPQPPEDVERVRRSYSIDESRYVLAVGNVQPRKNLTRLVRAYGSISTNFPDTKLVIVGSSTWRGSEVEAAVQEMGLGPRVLFTGYVPDDDLPALYTGAGVFCYPSLYEGFGLPPLEAMACGTPTITSNGSSLPEVVGDAALTVDPLSEDDIAAALRCFLAEEAARHEYSTRGRARAALFSWERTAQLTVEVYRKVIGAK